MLEFKAAFVDWMDSISILAIHRDGLGKMGAIGKPVTFTMERIEEGAFITDPTLKLDAQAAQSLMTALWQAGVRPSDFKSTAGEVKRLEDHLTDMRRLVFEEPKERIEVRGISPR